MASHRALVALTAFLGLAVAGSIPSLAQETASWPREITQGGAHVTIYQPQAVSWPDRTQLTARAAVAIEPAGSKNPVLGTIELSVATSVDSAAGVVTLSDPKLLGTHFPSLGTDRAAALEAKLRAALGGFQPKPVPLDAILLSLKQPPAAPSVAVSNDPPVILYSDRPASLVVFDGDPVMVPAGKSGLSHAVNTNWNVFTDGHAWYLLNNGLWLSAPAAAGPYAPAASLPAAFAKLPADANFAEVRKHVPLGKPQAGQPVPAIFVSMKPAEIIVTDGAPKEAPVAGTRLARVTNTPSVVYRDTADGKFYYLVSGRWFASPSLAQGPWTYAGDSLPPDFAMLPPAGEDDPVLASVPETVQAEEAVLKAQIPTSAALKRSAAKLNVAYSGSPQFKPIPGTSILYAVNTPYEVLKVGALYYACYQGAWFVSAAPTGPWALADSVPAVIYTIPPTSPLYNVTYVHVYAATPAAVTYGYTAGYTMGFITAGLLVYGTGYYYPPVVYPGAAPIFYPYPYTYAGNVWYNPANGAWARGGTVYGPYGGAATGGRYYNPTTGGWAQGGAIYGPNGGAGAFSYYNPHTGTYAHGSASWTNGAGSANASFYNSRTGVSGSTNQNFNQYSRWGSSTISGPNKTVNTQSRGNANGAVGSFGSSTGAAGAGYHNNVTNSRGGAARTANGDVYAGRDGNVYRHTDSGWSKWNDGWQPVNPPSRSGSTLNQSASPRTGGGGQNYGAAQRPRIDSENYRQLQYDRLGRQAGEGRFASEGGFAGRGGRFRR